MSVIFCDGEEQLIDSAKADSDKFDELYRLYQPRVYSYVLYRVSNVEVADDLTSQIFERALRKIDTYHAERGTFAVWLFAIARNAIRNHFRSSQIRRWVPLEIFTNHSSGSPQPDEIAYRNEQVQELMLLIATLANREQDILALKFGAGLTNRRIAELSGLSESNVAVIVFRTIRHLRDHFVNKEMMNHG